MSLSVLTLLVLTRLAFGDTLPRPNATAINVEAERVFDDLAAGQLAYIASNPSARFVQVLRESTPSDGSAPRGKSPGRPSDRTVDLDTIFPGRPAETFLCDYVVDEYEGPQGRGYILSCEIVLGSDRWRRCRQVGPEDRGCADAADGWQSSILQ